MNTEELFDAITDIRDDFVQEAKAHPPKGWARLWPRVSAAAAAAALVLGLALAWTERGPLPSEPGNHAISLAAYAPLPQGQNWGLAEAEQMAHEKAYEDWCSGIPTLQPSQGYQEGLDHFLRSSIPVFLTDGEENQVYSPIGTFMTLGMLAETTQGESRSQLLRLLNLSDLDALREKASDVWQGCYSSTENVESLLANSIWLSDSCAYRQSVMDNLTQYYYASSFQGNMGSKEYRQMLSQWITLQAGEGTPAPAFQPKFTRNTAMEIVSTVRYHARWIQPFKADDVTEGEFHGAGKTAVCDFMHRSEVKTYYRGQHFGAVEEPFTEGSIWFILPDEGTPAPQLLSDGEALEFILHTDQWEDLETAWVDFALPKFAADSQLDLRAGLEALGIVDIFYDEKADFSLMAQNNQEGLSLGGISQQTHVAVDEYGVSAGSFTCAELDWMGSAPLRVDFRLDRPFLFLITNREGLPLFVGIINQV